MFYLCTHIMLTDPDKKRIHFGCVLSCIDRHKLRLNYEEKIPYHQRANKFTCYSIFFVIIASFHLSDNDFLITYLLISFL